MSGKTLHVRRWLLAIVLALWVLLAPRAQGQFFGQSNDWVSYRQRHDLMGQSYRDTGPGGWGYYTPTFLPGIDDFNGPSRAFSPIFNAPQAAPRGSAMQPQALYPPPAPRAAARSGLLRRVLRRR